MKKRTPGKNQFTKAKALGLPIPLFSEETKKKIFETKVKNGTFKHTEESKRKISDAMKLAVKKYPESYTSSNRGRTKQIVFENIKFQGQWELDFYIWAKNNNLNPKRCIEGFNYVWNGNRTYYPDFYIEKLDLFVEVKGYETDRDRAKWNQFPKKLCVIKSKEIKEIRNKTFIGPVAHFG